MYKNIFTIIILTAYSCMATTTIDPANQYGYGANIGWINAEANTNNGAVIGQAFCSGYIYSANCGWISLGDGSPDNGMSYANNSATDFGVNHDGHANLSGYAYGANIGWITFEQTYGQPKVDLMTGNLSGYAYGANVGWINLNGIRTLSLAAPDSDGDGIADAWEYAHTNILSALGSGDADGDGISDINEYLADTDPLDSGDYLRISNLQVSGSTNEITWPVKTTRLYTLEHTGALTNNTEWIATKPSFIPSSGPDITETVSGITATNRFYRVQAEPPLNN